MERKKKRPIDGKQIECNYANELKKRKRVLALLFYPESLNPNG